MKHIGKLILSSMVLIPSLLWSQPNKPVEALIHEIKSSTDSIRIQRAGQDLSIYEPKTNKDIESLVEAMQDEKIAPYAQQAVARAKDPALGPALHEGLKSLKAGLKHMPPETFNKMSREEQSKAMARAMDVAVIADRLGEMKYQPAVSDLKELLSYGQEFEGYIQWAASKALGELGDEQSLQTIMQAASQGKTVTLSGYKLRGIRKIIEKIDELDAQSGGKRENPLDPQVRERWNQIHDLAQQLGHAGRKDPSIRDALQQLLVHRTRDVRVWAANALIDSIEPSDKSISLEMLRHKDAGVRLRGLDSLYLSKTWDKSFMPILIDMVQHDPDPIVRHSAVDTLESLPAIGVRRKDLQDAVPYLEALLDDKGRGLQYSAYLALRSITGRYHPYKGMPESEKKIMEREPAYQPELGVHENANQQP